MSQFLRRNLLKSSSLQFKMNEVTKTEEETRIKVEKPHPSNLNDWKSNSAIKEVKQLSDSNQEISSHEVNKQLIFGINSLVARKVSKQYVNRRE
ncbi:unnamed protein product [Trichobilharzia regenti]|nr:unnamed protein product [Trichobilharzia regenti]